MQGGIWLETAGESFCFVLWAYGILWISELCFLSSCSTWGVFNRFYGTELYFLAECKYSRVSMAGKKASPSLWGKCNWPTSCIFLLSPHYKQNMSQMDKLMARKMIVLEKAVIPLPQTGNRNICLTCSIQNLPIMSML